MDEWLSHLRLVSVGAHDGDVKGVRENWFSHSATGPLASAGVTLPTSDAGREGGP